MNWDRVEGNWKQIKGKVRQQRGKLTDDDVELVKGERTELAGRIQQRCGVAHDAAERQIDMWIKLGQPARAGPPNLEVHGGQLVAMDSRLAVKPRGPAARGASHCA